MNRRPRVAVVHDWLNGMRGGEKVLEAILELVPGADLFTLLHEPGTVSPLIESHRIFTSALQKFPAAFSKYRNYLPLFPQLIQNFDLSAYDVVLSSSHCVAKGVRKAPHAKHVSYVHAPMRYMWDRFDDYFGPGKASLPVRCAARALRPWIQAWDRRTSQVDRIDGFIANSEYIARCLRDFYGREASVVYPFQETTRFEKLQRERGDFYLVFGALAPNKRVDLAVDAFEELGLKLLIAGTGQELGRLQKRESDRIRFLGKVDDAQVDELLRTCRALIFPGKEDFGITPLEAMASGAPVIAFGEGGAVETVVHGHTGLHFRPQSAEALRKAVLHLESDPTQIESANCRARAAQFSKKRFQDQYLELLRSFSVKL